MKFDMMSKGPSLDEINRALDLARERDPFIEPEPGYSCGNSETHWAVPNAEEIGPESTLLSELERIHLAFSGGDRAIRAAIIAHLAAFQDGSFMPAGHR
jgi:hypothetical protein